MQKRINEAIAHLQAISSVPVDYRQMDPVAKMMLVALMYEAQKIRDYVDGIGLRLADRFCEDFIPSALVEAVPAVALVAPCFKKNKDDVCIQLSPGVAFSFKTKLSKSQINYLPLFKNTLIPCGDVYVLTPSRLKSRACSYDVSMDRPNTVWVGIHTNAEIESLEGFSLFLQKPDNVYPRSVSVVGSTSEGICFSTMNRMEDLEMLEPFDAQQVSGRFLSVMECWKEILQELPGGVLVVFTDKARSRDMFKKRAYPRVFQNWLESEVLNCFGSDILWLQIDFPEDYVVSECFDVIPNAIPVANVDVGSVTLTQTAPVAKLQKQDGAYFLAVLETSNHSHGQGFPLSSEEFVIRDFDAHCYDNGDLYRDVRNLYNRFVEDYHAFVEYNGLKDGQDIRRLKELVNKIAKAAGEENNSFKYGTGTYVMKNIRHSSASSVTKVSFVTTQGALGNLLGSDTGLGASHKLECKKLPVIENDVPVVVPAMGGRDKASADRRYELIRYFTLTNDRLFTKMDIEAFARKELVALFGSEEFKRIFVKVSVEGAAGRHSVQRGVYVDIEFKDRKNYDRAKAKALDVGLRQMIVNKSCLTMPVIVVLKNMEEE